MKSKKLKRYSKLILLLLLKIILVILFVLTGFILGTIIFAENIILVTIFALLFATLLYLYLFKIISKAILG